MLLYCTVSKSSGYIFWDIGKISFGYSSARLELFDACVEGFVNSAKELSILWWDWLDRNDQSTVRETLGL